jgi:UTP--glucose-1-phosphate uridylyltransferase
VAYQDVNQYGIVDIDGVSLQPGESAQISCMVEKPTPAKAPSNLAVLGRYILSPRVMTLLEGVKPGAGGEIQLTDALDKLLAEQPLEAFLSAAQVHDCGNKEGFVKANMAVAERAGMKF